MRGEHRIFIERRVMSDLRSGLLILGRALVLVTVGLAGEQGASAGDVTLVESTISLTAISRAEPSGAPVRGRKSELERAYVGQLILRATDPNPAAKQGTELPCLTGGLAADGNAPNLQAFCDIADGLASFQITYAPRYLGRNGKEHRWSVTANVDGILPASSISRYATAVIDGAQYWLPIQYKTAAAPVSTLTVAQPPNRWVIARQGDEISLQVHNKGGRVSQLAIVNSSLQSTDTNKRLNVDAFVLCSSPKDSGDSECPEGVSLPADTTTTVYLRTNTEISPGQYGGALTFVSDGTALSKPIELLVFSSGTKIQWIGLLLIAAGVILGLLISVVIPHQAQRLETLRPAVSIRTSATQWLDRLAESEAMTSESFSQSKRSLEDIGARLADGALEGNGYLPGYWPLPLKLTTKSVQTYDAYLKANNDALYVTAAIIANGLESIAIRWADYSSNPAHRELAKTSLRDLDGLSRSGSRTTIRASIATILKMLDTDIAAAGAGSRMRVGERTVQTTIESLTAELRTLSAGGWLIWVIITIAGGWAALILTNSGFGTVRDLFTCFGWGLGLQVVGPALQQLTPAKIAKQIRVELPQ